MINYRLKIDFSDSKVYTSDICFVSGDVKSSTLYFEFYDEGKRIDISGFTLSVRAKRSDGVVVASAGKIENNTAVFTPESNLYAVPGEVYMEIALSDVSGKYATTKVIIAEVIEGLGEAAIEGSDNLNVYVTLINEAIKAKEEILAYVYDKPGEKVSGGGEIFNDYDKNIALGKYSTASGHQSSILDKVEVSEQEIKYISYDDNVLTLSAADNFFDTAPLWGFRIENTNTKIQSDVLKVLSSTKNSDGSWSFETEAPIEALNLGTPKSISIMAILNGEETGEYACAEGWGNLVIGRASHAENWNNKALENYEHLEGTHNIGRASGVHIEGGNNEGRGSFTHIEGCNNISEEGSNYSHIEGIGNESKARNTHLEGYRVISKHPNAHYQGKFNDIEDETEYAHVVGGGTSENDRKNIHTLDWDGNAYFAGDVTIGKDRLVVATRVDVANDIENAVGDIGTALDAVIALQESYIGGV